jgi:hypothetical protein
MQVVVVVVEANLQVLVLQVGELAVVVPVAPLMLVD